MPISFSFLVFMQLLSLLVTFVYSQNPDSERPGADSGATLCTFTDSTCTESSKVDCSKSSLAYGFRQQAHDQNGNNITINSYKLQGKDLSAHELVVQWKTVPQIGPDETIIGIFSGPLEPGDCKATVETETEQLSIVYFNCAVGQQDC